jgi:HEAT repeat protein
MAASHDSSAIDRALGALGTTFRLSRLYPAAHPAVQESLRQVSVALPGVAALGTVEWKVGHTGLHWQHQHLLPRNTQLAELAGLLYARGVRGIVLHPGVTVEHVLALFGVATGSTPPDDPSLGRLSLSIARRSTRLSSATRSPSPPPQAAAPAPAGPGAPAGAPVAMPVPEPALAGKVTNVVLRDDVLPVDVQVKRAVAALEGATTGDAMGAAAEQLATLAPALVASRDVATIATVIGALDQVLPRVEESALAERIGAVGTALTDAATVERMVRRLGELRVPPGERALLVKAVGALGAVVAGQVVDVYLAAPAELREPFRAAIRAAGDRAVEQLGGRLTDARAEVVAAAAHLLGLTGSPNAVPLLVPLIRHRAELVQEATLHALTEVGGREISRPAMTSLKAESAVIRAAAAQVIGVGGDPGATTVLVRRLEQEEDEGVLAELLKAIGRLGAPQALAVLARHAEPGGRADGRTPHVRAAAIEGLGYLNKPEARGLLELYARDKEPTVRRAAEAALR